MEIFLATAQFTSSSGSSKNATTIDYDYDDGYFHRNDNNNQQKKKKVILSDRLLACLDKHKISNAAGMHIIAAVASALSVNIEDYILNEFNLRKARNIYRQSIAESKQNHFHVIVYA